MFVPVSAEALSDACPGIARLHEAADGHLARIRLPGGTIDARGLRAVAAAAALGNGIVELTSRAGLQVRGLAVGAGEDVARLGAAGEDIARLLAAGGLLPSSAHDRVRNILAHPLGGRAAGALAYTDPVVTALDRALCADLELAALPGRFLFAVDDGTRVLAPLAADVELVAERDGFRLRLAGTPTAQVTAPADAPAVAIAAARAFLELRATHAPGEWRVRDLPAGGRQLAERLGLGLGPLGRRARPLGSGPAGRLPGVARQRDGRASVTALAPLARLDAAQLEGLAALVAASSGTVRLSSWRTLSLPDAEDPAAVTAALSDLGFVLAPGSGWEGLTACAGLGACARARADVRAAAARRASVRRAGSPHEHWSGCERRCGEPPGAGVTVVATACGLEVTAGGRHATADGLEVTTGGRETTAAGLEVPADTRGPRTVPDIPQALALLDSPPVAA